MPLLISQKAVLEITGVSHTTVINALSHSHVIRHDRHPHYYLSEVVNYLNRHAKSYIDRLTYASEDDQELYVGVHGLKLSESFDSFVSNDTNMKARAKTVRNSFMNSLALSDGARCYMTYSETLRLKLLLNGGVSMFLLTGDSSDLPLWYSFSPAFALCNSGLDTSGLKVAA